MLWLSALLVAAALWSPRTPSRDVIVALNGMRQREGVAPLVVDGTLTSIAAHQARSQLECGRVGHFGCDGEYGFRDRMRKCAGLTRAAENVGSCASALNATGMLLLWKASPAHRRNMFGAEYKAGGAGRACGEGTCYWALVVAAPQTPCDALTISNTTRNTLSLNALLILLCAVSWVAL